jgi:phospholipid/cholesterol/gamma-HCH transport system ATP-binding protein
MVLEDPIVQVKDLSARYDETRLVLKEINFSIQPGEIFMVIGGSGSGKTTLLTNMLGLRQPESGEVWIDGDEMTGAGEKQTEKILRKIGVTYQSGALFGSLNLLENVSVPLKELTLLPNEAIEMIAANKLKTVGLGNFIYYMPDEISGGMRKRAAIARAMALDPKILFLDEPSAGLDPITSACLDNLISDLSDTLGITFVIVTHELDSIYKIGEHVIMLHNGGIVAEGTPDELKATTKNITVRRFFHRESF